MWDEGVSVFDAYANEEFTLCAILLCTVNDYLAYDNLLGYKNKGKKVCPICIDNMRNPRGFLSANIYSCTIESYSHEITNIVRRK